MKLIEMVGSVTRAWQTAVMNYLNAYTELDINLRPNTPRGADPTIANPYPSGLPDEVQQQLARRYAEVFRVFLKHRDAVTRVTFWGLSDADSWLNRGRTIRCSGIASVSPSRHSTPSSKR